MPDLIAEGPQPEFRWRRSLVPGRGYIVGRQAGAWSTPWDTQISRRHVEICWVNQRLEVKRLPQTRNGVFVRGLQCEAFFIKPGEHFVIGQTRFTLADEAVNVTAERPGPVAEQTFSQQQLRQVRFRNADQRIEVLSRLPEIIKGAASEKEMLVRLVNILLAGLPSASAVAIVAASPDPKEQVRVLHWDRRRLSGEEFQPSVRLIRRAIDAGETVIHHWRGAGADQPTLTAALDLDWAFCTPLPQDSGRPWAIYVSGDYPEQNSGDDRLREELKFTELAASNLATLLEVRLLERRHASLSQFFSPVVLESLSLEDPEEVLRPREAEVIVLFCDLRGFSLSTEKSAGDLQGLLQRVSQSLGVMTKHIQDTGGVVGDFHGDSAMGFWGWPLAYPDSIERACRAALGIRRDFSEASQRADHALTNFRMGIGIAAGRAVCGKLGAVDQVKVSVFGPVVVRASRLEGMTKFFRAPILLDDAAAAAIRAVGADWLRLRRVARVIPYGMQTPLEITELLPPQAEFPQLRDEHVRAYEEGLDHLLRGDWSQALESLHQVPADDRVKDFLTMLIMQNNRTAPPNWNGVIPLTAK